MKRGGRSRRPKKAKSTNKDGGWKEEPAGRLTGLAANSPIQRMSEVRICRYLVFWALKKANGPSRRVKAACRGQQRAAS